MLKLDTMVYISYNKLIIMTKNCTELLCFVNLNQNGPKIFGFSEFLAGLALMILAWTIADTRYRFRIKTAPLALEKITFYTVTLVGVLSLLTDLWRAQGWPVLKGSLISQAGWQALLAGVFFLIFLVWVFFAFIRPSVFSRWTAKKYGNVLYGYIVRGYKNDLIVIADEITRSIPNLVKYATNGSEKDGGESVKKTPLVELVANEILVLISDKRFCKAVAESALPLSILLFTEMDNCKKYRINVDIFAKNFFTEAILNTDSFLYHESNYYDSGFIGYVKPLSTALFKNYVLVENLSIVFDIDSEIRKHWSVKQFDVFCNAFLLTIKSYLQGVICQSPTMINRALGYITDESSGIYKVNGMLGSWDSEPVRRLDVCVNFLNEVSCEISNVKKPSNFVLRNKVKGVGRYRYHSIYDAVAKNMLDVIYYASAVKSPIWDCWSIQHNTVLDGFFQTSSIHGKPSEIIKHKLRRLLYEEVIEMERFPNYKGARFLSFILNVLGLKLHPKNIEEGTNALHRCVLAWMNKRYAILYKKNPEVALACLTDTMKYDEVSNQITQTTVYQGINTTTRIVNFSVIPIFP
ncbi:hypothetical protein [Hafnia alvei]|uniref:hypothetical protein n=1 Tax=Hafnia alvei TaxID=569 RepID=UPI0007BF9B97|nr:hypothetical protein [Hafnia alvei]